MAMASRVMPASGPVSTRSSPSSALTSVDLPALGWPMMASSQGACRESIVALFASSSSDLVARLSRIGYERLIEPIEALAMLGRDRDRIAKTQRIGIENAGLRRR